MNRTYLKVNQDPTGGCQPNETMNGKRLVKKKKEEEEEWNDGPSTTSKSKKSIVRYLRITSLSKP